MSDEKKNRRPEKVLRIGEHSVRITEPEPIAAVAADAYSELRLVGGSTVALTLVTLNLDGVGEPEARTCARLRIPLETFADIQRGVAGLLETATRPRSSTTN